LGLLSVGLIFHRKTEKAWRVNLAQGEPIKGEKGPTPKREKIPGRKGHRGGP